MTGPTTSTGSHIWRSLGLLKSERVLSHNLIVGGGTVTAGILGVAFQSLASHQLKPGDYGSVFAVVTLITLIGLPASGLTLLMARETSRGQASGNDAPSANLLRRGNRALMGFGIVLAILIVLASPILARFLDVPAALLAAAAVGLPFAIALPLLLGEFQGQQRFTAYSLIMIGQAGVKLIAAIALGIVFGPLGVIAGVSLATITIYVVALRLLRRKFGIRANLSWWRPTAGYLAIVLPSTLSLAVLLSADVLLVKHYFPTPVAGQYAAVAALGRAIFWGASGVAAVLFPKVVMRATQGQSGVHLVGASLSLVALGGLASLIILWLASRWILVAFAGAAYSGVSVYLPWYGIGMILLGSAAVLIAVHQATGKRGFLALLIPLSLLEPVLLITFHQNLTQVVQVLDVSMALVVGGLGALYAVQHRALQLDPVPGSARAATGIAPMGINK